MKKLKFFLMVLSVGPVIAAHGQSKLKTENVVLITFDGFRWQEVFNGADSSFMNQQNHLKDPKVKEKYWRDDLAQRRAVLLPFFWSTIATKGQVYGNRNAGSKVNVTNNQWFSYPGYNEILTGRADDVNVTSNDKFYNPNTTVLEFLQGQPAFKGKVVAFTSWDVFPYIINDKRSGVTVSAGLQEAGHHPNEKEKVLNEVMKSIPNPLGDVRLDAFTFYYGLEYMKKNKPRVVYYSFDETDDFAHQGEYAAYLNSANYTDRFISELWAYLQTDPFYKDKTTVIITSDHGRGNNDKAWRSHGRDIENADQIWLAVMGPDTPARGEEKKEGQLYQNQVAKTLAAFLGMNYQNKQPVGEAIQAVLGGK